MEEKLVSFILQDYFHWRRNYYPSDEIVIPQSVRRELVDWSDDLGQKLAEMLAGLRKHFPFYSPRYLAHMMSDQTLPSVLGYFAGLLYNPNNVTPEAAPVTERWEFEVGRDILEMMGYKMPPQPGGPHEARSEFGWAHVTSGGTVANIEALWAARNAAYFPLAVRRVVCELQLPFGVTLPDQSSCNLADLDEQQCLGLAPGEILHLLPRLVAAIERHLNVPPRVAIGKTPELLAATGFSIPHNGVTGCYQVRPPAIFVSSAKHYSLTKAADVLGIGRDNVVLVEVDGLFRMDVRDLEAKIKLALRGGMLPMAVIAIAGTTEEGAVDPIHEVLDLRHELEAELRASFWLHVDAAWSGYLRSLFYPDAGSLAEHVAAVRQFVSRELDLSDGAYSKTLPLSWGDQDVLSAFLAMSKADSITVDPHKMGYVPYPCGVVAFRNDRVRQFLAEAAPYLASTMQPDESMLDHTPPTSIGPYILEGSKPGAAVAGVWLSHRMIPLNRDGYGEIVRASILAARELYERLVHWEHWAAANKVEPSFEFMPLTPQPPTQRGLFPGAGEVQPVARAHERIEPVDLSAVHDRVGIPRGRTQLLAAVFPDAYGNQVSELFAAFGGGSAAALCDRWFGVFRARTFPAACDDHEPVHRAGRGDGTQGPAVPGAVYRSAGCQGGRGCSAALVPPSMHLTE